MVFIQNLLCTIADVFLLADILICATLINKSGKKPYIIKNALFIIAFITFSILFYNVGFSIKNPLLKMIILIIFYARFPIITMKMTNTSLIKSIYISFLSVQSFSILKSLIFNIIDNHINSFFEDIIKAVISVTLKTAILIILLTFSKTIKTNRTLHIIPKSVYVLIIINVTLMGAITSITGYNLSIESNITKRITITNALLLLIFIISIAITVSLISNCISKAYYNKINSILEKQIENQIEYYNQTEMLNSDLRRFKHDYTNHILCLKALIDSNQNNEALEYIEKINSEISLSTKTFNTGHKIADAILNEKHRIHSDISIKFEGCIPDFIDNVDLCIVLGNAVDNAIEACEKLNKTDKIIDITVNYQQSHFILIIKNPVAKDYIINGSFPETTKADPLKHGFGLSNIKHIVDKYEGDMSVKADNGTFTLYLALKANQGE